MPIEFDPLIKDTRRRLFRLCEDRHRRYACATDRLLPDGQRARVIDVQHYSYNLREYMHDTVMLDDIYWNIYGAIPDSHEGMRLFGISIG